MQTASLDQASAIAERLLGRPPTQIEPYTPTVGGDDSRGFVLWRGRDKMLLNMKKRPGSPVGVYFHRRIAEAGIPVPELVAHDPCGGPGGEACAIWEWVEGVPAEWGPGEPCPYDEAELGTVLRAIHELRFDGPFGFLGDALSRRWFTGAPDLAPTADAWPGFFLCDRAARRYLAKGYLTRDEADILASVPERLGPWLDVGEARLLHMGDIMHNGNLIVDPASGKILAVVDYAESTAGDPRWELAWIDYYFGQYPYGRRSFDMARFRQAYGTDHDPHDATGSFYLAAILLFEKLLFFRPCEARGAWAIRTLKELLARLKCEYQ